MKKVVLIVVALVTLFAWDDIYWKFRPLPQFSETDNVVILYSTEWCSYCEKARRLLKKVRVPFEENDVEKSDEAKDKFIQLGGSGVPLLVVNNKIINGYSEEEILASLVGKQD